VLVFASAVLQALIFPSPGLAFLSWIAFVPLLAALLAEGVRLGRGFLLGYVCGILWYALTCFWVYHTMHTYGGLSAPMAVGIVILFCLYLGLYHGLFGLLLVFVARRQGSAIALWLSPVLWVAIELARYHITGFPWDLLGTAVVDNVPVASLATLGGVYFVSFIVFAVNALIAKGALNDQKRLLVAGLVLGLCLQLAKQLPQKPIEGNERATLIQPNLPILYGWDAVYFDRQMFDLTDLSRQSIKTYSPQPRLIVWPESPAPFYSDDQKFRTWMQALAADKQTYIVAGTVGVTGEGPQRKVYNSASLVAPTGAFVSRYDKIRLVPFGEYVPFENLLFFAQSLVKEVGHFSRGNQRNTLELGGHKAGVFICYESVFPDEVRQFAANGAQVFVNISNDEWFGQYGAPGQHLNMARMRAIENRRWVLRSTNSGITASIDPYGRVVAQAERNLRTALNAPYAYVEETTFYTRHGDLFAYACAIISLVMLLVRVRFRAGRMVP